MLPLACYNDKQFYQETLPEAICCCLQTLLIFIPLIEYKVMFTLLLPLVSDTASLLKEGSMEMFFYSYFEEFLLPNLMAFDVKKSPQHCFS